MLERPFIFSIPKESFFKRNSVFLEETDVLLLKAFHAVMFRLILNVPDCIWNMRGADGKGSITRLPSEVPQLSKCFMKPG